MNEPYSLPEPLLTLLGGIINAALEADPMAKKGLRELAGRCIMVHISDFTLGVSAHIEANGLHLGGAMGAPDALVTGTLAQLLAAGRSGSPKGLSVTGDAELVHGLSRIMVRLPAAAWERLAQTIGDVPARGLERLGAGLRIVLGNTRERLETTLGEYLQYEIRALPSRGELEAFLSAVDRLRDDTERLGKRIERLERH